MFKMPPFTWLGGFPGGGGGDSEKRRVRIKRYGILQPIRFGRELLSGKFMPVITFAGVEGANTGVKSIKRRLKKLYA
jgi:hypothetical protein